ncbi:MAG: Smr/MutS family protein, partial [bacterium]
RIHRRLSELINRHQDDVLQDTFYTDRAERYVLPVKAPARQKISGIVHGSSGSGQTVFIEPSELVESNNELKLIGSEIEAEIKRILADLSARVAGAADQILTNQNALAHIDVVRARARLALELDATRPAVNGEGRIGLVNARHPLLVLRGHNTVPNDFAMDRDRQVLVISGPNTGGKTAALSMLGLIAFMVRAGMFIPAAEDSEMAVFNEVFAVMGDEQDLSRDLSSFSAHVLDIIGTIESAGAGSLVLLDELMSSTDPVEGGALAAAVLRELRDQGARVLATTHIPALKSFAHEETGFVNAGFAFDPDTLAPTYKLMVDTPGQSLGIDIAKRLGLPERLIKGARSEMDDASLRMESLIAELSEKIKDIESERGDMEAERKRAARLSEEYRSYLERAQEHERDMKKRVRSEAAAVVRRTEAELERILKEARQEGSRESVHKGREKLREVSGRLAEEYGQEEGELPDWTRLKKGDKVLVMPLSVEAELMEAPGKEVKPEDTLQVRMGKLKVQVEAGKIRELKKSAPSEPVLQKPSRKQKKPKPEKPAEPPESGPPAATPQTSENTLDLRGMRYQEAEARLEGFLDQACGKHLPNVYIIHGHGTGALKKMVREELSVSPYVSEFRPGEKGEGGDGVTMAELKDLSYRGS